MTARQRHLTFIHVALLMNMRCRTKTTPIAVARSSQGSTEGQGESQDEHNQRPQPMPCPCSPARADVGCMASCGDNGCRFQCATDDGMTQSSSPGCTRYHYAFTQPPRIAGPRASAAIAPAPIAASCCLQGRVPVASGLAPHQPLCRNHRSPEQVAPCAEAEVHRIDIDHVKVVRGS